MAVGGCLWLSLRIVGFGLFWLMLFGVALTVRLCAWLGIVLFVL